MALQLLRSALPGFFTSSGFCPAPQPNESLFMDTLNLFFFNREWTWYSKHHKSFRSGAIQLNASHWEWLLGCTKKCFVWGIYRNQSRVCWGTFLSVSVRENLFVSKFALARPRCSHMTMSFECHLEISTICLANLYKHSQVYHIASVMAVVIM